MFLANVGILRQTCQTLEFRINTWFSIIYSWAKEEFVFVCICFKSYFFKFYDQFLKIIENDFCNITKETIVYIKMTFFCRKIFLFEFTPTKILLERQRLKIIFSKFSNLVRISNYFKKFWDWQTDGHIHLLKPNVRE